MEAVRSRAYNRLPPHFQLVIDEYNLSRESQQTLYFLRIADENFCEDVVMLGGIIIMSDSE